MLFDFAGMNFGHKKASPAKKKCNLDHLSKRECGAAAYQLGNTSSRTITEVKQR